MGDFSISSRDIQLADGYSLIASCQDLDGGWVNSHIDLDAFIGSNDGHFEWGHSGFSYSAKDVALCFAYDGRTWIQADLRTADGQFRQDSVCLDDKISNENGQLQYND
ncbi:hypothetical protein BGZ58_006359 [Dissophora ornata]|nr:hypothetical protein BGZ58_006359 [Dissophora ornata]